MQTIGLVDADLLDGGTRFPNLALMKIASFERSRGAAVRLCLTAADATPCAKIFVSKVFTKSRVPRWIEEIADRCEFGGTGFNLVDAPPLPPEAERSKPFYDLYKQFVDSFGDAPPRWLDAYSKTSIGFTSRGCFRRCPFCVNRKKTRSERWSPVAEFLDETRPYVDLLDDNVFACKDWREIFAELESTGKRFAFKQGLDIRLTDREKAATLARAKYRGDVTFAFDNIADEREFRRGAENFRAECDKQAKAYLLCGFYQRGLDELRDLFKRLDVLAEYRILPYLMRHERYENDEYKAIYVDLARWLNQPGFFKKLSFLEFAEKAGSRKTRSALASNELASLKPWLERRFWK